MGYNTKQLKASPLEKKNPKPKDVIVDPMGQWKHPGEITKIPSGDITMKGVPYPVLGVDNLGNQIMMHPGMDYTFPGDSVTEYPQMKHGGLPRRSTNKNIQSSINKLMGRNELLFGPPGKHYYEPSKQTSMNKKKSGGEAFPQQPTENQFFNFGYIPSGPQGFYAFGGVNETPEAYPQLNTMQQFFMYEHGGNMPCMECGGYHMQQGGQPTGTQMMDNMAEYKSGGGHWIQKATASIKRRGTEGVCTGSKFGSSSCPPGSKRYNLAKTFRAMAKKQFGGDIDADDMGASSTDTDQDDFLEQYRNTFKNAVKNNTGRAIADEVANHVAMEQEAIARAQYGMSMQNYGYNPSMGYMDLYNQKDAYLKQKNKQAGQQFMGATQNLFNTANPYMQWSMQEGGYMPTPNYQNQWKTQPGGRSANTRGYTGFPMNYNPYTQWNVMRGDQNTPMTMGNTYLQSYEAKKQLFGPGARKVKMTFRTFYNPQTGQMEHAPEQSIMKQPGWSPTEDYKRPHINSYQEDLNLARYNADKAGVEAQANQAPSIYDMPLEEVVKQKGVIHNEAFDANNLASPDDMDRIFGQATKRQKGGPAVSRYPETTLSPQDSIYFTKELAKPMYDPNKYSYRSVDNSGKGTKRHPVDDQVFKTIKATGKEVEIPPAMWNPGVMKEIIRRQQVAAGQEPTYAPLFWPQPPATAQKQYGGGMPMAQFGMNAYGQEDPQGTYFDTTVTGKRKMGLDSEASANWILAGISGLSALGRNREYAKNKEQMQRKSLADNQFNPVPNNAIQNQGRWNPTGMSYGMMDPFNMDVVQQPGMNYAMEGPAFRDGGEYELTPAQIDYIKKNGGSVTYLD